MSRHLWKILDGIKNKIPILWDQKCVNLPQCTSWIVIDYKQCFSLRFNEFVLKYFIVSIMKRKYDMYWDLTKFRLTTNIIRPRKYRFTSVISKIINLLLHRKNIVACTWKDIFLYLNTSDSLINFLDCDEQSCVALLMVF